MRDQLLLRASALTYVTALAIVPLLAVILAMLRMVGADQKLANAAIEQITAGSPGAREGLMEVVQGANLASLGTVGGAVLLVMTVFALRHLETTLNELWGVHKSRSWSRRFSDYLAVMIVGPLSTGAAVSLATTLQSDPAVRWLFDYPVFVRLHSMGLAYLPQLFLVVGFTFLFWFFPNTKVKIRSALLGGIVAAVLFSVTREFYVDFHVGVAKYSALFGGFAALPLLLAWLYVCWAIVLLGAEVSYASQNLLHFRREVQSEAATSADLETMGVRIAVAIAEHFSRHRPPPGVEDLCEELDACFRTTRDLLHQLESAGLICQAASVEREGGYLPARPLTDLSIGDVLRAVRGERSPAGVGFGSVDVRVGEVLDSLDSAWNQLADGLTLAELLGRKGPAGEGGVA